MSVSSLQDQIDRNTRVRQITVAVHDIVAPGRVRRRRLASEASR